MQSGWSSFVGLLFNFTPDRLRPELERCGRPPLSISLSQAAPSHTVNPTWRIHDRQRRDPPLPRCHLRFSLKRERLWVLVLNIVCSFHMLTCWRFSLSSMDNKRHSCSHVKYAWALSVGLKPLVWNTSCRICTNVTATPSNKSSNSPQFFSIFLIKNVEWLSLLVVHTRYYEEHRERKLIYDLYFISGCHL